MSGQDGRARPRRHIIPEPVPRYALPPAQLPALPPPTEPGGPPPQPRRRRRHRHRRDDVLWSGLLTAASVACLLVASGLHLLR
ncbi:hypothetical protein [Streptomyces sp. NPDC058739]|uniref:hypothetical protein n=1 Tax=Streptomyces sp. NPDC058739 TaxID=3346618 RepID=UPI00368FB403